MPKRALFHVWVVLTLLLGGCASTTITDTWSDPTYNGGPFKRIMVVAVTQNGVARRTFEDIFAGRLRANGVDAVPGYQFVQQDGPVSESVLNAAVRASGADGMLMVHLVHVDRQTRV